ncbi:MAG: hypothetical protein IMZ64_08650 [Bacteroidetes bacterium]|nr:hypothetical protein [Bacteroidota bacterium]
MKKRFRRKIIEENNAVSEVIGGIMLIMIVVATMTTMVLVNQKFLQANQEVANASMDVAQRFVDWINSKFLLTNLNPGNKNNPPVIKVEYPADGANGIPLMPTCRALVNDLDGDKLAVKFFFYTEVQQSWTPYKDLFIIDSNTTASCVYIHATVNEKTYYWQVTAFDGTSLVTSEVYRFTTVAYPTG